MTDFLSKLVEPEFVRTLTAVIIGALVGGWMTYVVTKRAEKRREAENKRALAKALKAELKAAWDKYMDPFGNWINEDEDKIKNGEKGVPPVAIPIFENYLSIFYSNTGKLGLFSKEDKVMDRLLNFYVNAKGLSDSLKHYDEGYKEYRSISDFPGENKIKDKILKDMKFYLKSILDQQRELEKELPQIFDLLKKEGMK